MNSRAWRAVLLSAGIALTFGVVVAVMLQLLPGPHTGTDYMVIGSGATLVSLLLLFLVATCTWSKSRDVFFKRRRE